MSNPKQLFAFKGVGLKLARIKINLKQLELSRRTGLSPKRLSQIENGWVEPNDKEIALIVEALETTPTEPNEVTYE